MTVGLTPVNAADLNNQLGSILRQFITIKEGVDHWHDWLVPVDLKTDPYLFTIEEETLIKSAIADLDTALDAINMTFITRLVGPFT